MRRFLNPRNDFAFKQLFGTEKNKDILIHFLNDMFRDKYDKIEDVEFLKTNQDPEIASLRQSIVDVLCKDTKGNMFIIEMQCATDSHFIERAVSYACRAYLNQRTKGRSYGDMKPVIFFAILEHTLFDDKKEYLSYHKVTDIYTGENDIKNLSFTFLELSKFKKESINELETDIEKWTYFFKNAEGVSVEELEEIEEKDKLFWKVYTTLAEYNYSPEELMEYERYEMKQDEINTLKMDAKNEGMAEGKAEGMSEGIAKGMARGITIGEERGKEKGIIESKKEIVLSMLADNLPLNIISKYTNLSIKEIEILKR
jgi:predicted transposase/invertase (TIGR01784 family)